MGSTDVNSREYWDARFHTDWDVLGGQEQSRFFARLALDAMPAWFHERLRAARLTFCDWGCAEGAGTQVLAEALGAPTTGIDFSSEAIAIARQRHPGIEFLAADVLASPIDDRFDIVFSSNTLEHFHAPWDAFHAIAKLARRYVVLLLPYRELDRHAEHFVSFTPSDLPAAREGLVLVHAAVVDAAALPDSAWPGEQVLCIYASPEEVEDTSIALVDLNLDTPAIEGIQADLAMRIRNFSAITEELTRLQVEHVQQTQHLEGFRRDHALLQAAHMQQAQHLEDARRGHALLQAAHVQQAIALDAARSDAQVNLAERDARHAILNDAYRALELRLPKLELDSADLARIRNSRLWRWSAPLRLLKRLITGRTTLSHAGRSLLAAASRMPLGAKTRQRLALGARRDAFDPVGVHLSHSAGDAVRPAQAQPGKSDVFVWAVIDWHFRIQRPQHLARALAGRGHRVFYVSNNFIDSPDAGFDAELLDGDARLFQINLHVRGSPVIYSGMPTKHQRDDLQASLGRLLAWAGTSASVSFVQHPFWLDIAGRPPNLLRIYDCMDHHAGFENNAPALVAAESELIKTSDLVVVTSSWLESALSGRAKQISVVRNAGEYAFFSNAPRKVFRDPDGRRIIGYYGAIAAWFDLALVEQVARAYPDVLVLLIGADTTGAAQHLASVPNVRLEGEVPYTDLPYWLHSFDVCLLPFRVIDLTLATNPVKVYEYLAAGKPVVAVDLPEMTQFEGLVRTARDRPGFVAAVGQALDEPQMEFVARRKAFAAGQSWEHRAAALDQAVAAISEPKISVIVLTYNNLAFTQACLCSIEAYSDYPNLEIIVVDNASMDGSPEWLQEWQHEPSPVGHVRRLILNERNLGFSAGNNVGLLAASGEFLIVLNNDTYVTPGWVRTLCAHFRRDASLGLVGPVTNNIGNEACVDMAYSSMTEMIAQATAYTRARPGVNFPIRTAAFFCVAMPRALFEQVGGMDEAFGIGFFEDDDYCRRVERAGFGIACAEDVFVHHHLSASFDNMKADEKRELFERNKQTYEAKWGAWTPHAYRSTRSQI